MYGADPVLRHAVLIFSGALDDIERLTRIATVRDINGQTRLLGPIGWATAPYWRIDIPANTEEASGATEVLTIFERIRLELGLTQREMFTATGIRKRTYHSWRRKPLSAKLRVASLGRFWRLVDAVEDLDDTLDRPLDQWIRGDQLRMEALLGGRFDVLVDLAVNRPMPPKREIGTSVYTGIAEDIEMPIIRSGKRNIEEVEDGYQR
ncbi:hypothetical protein [Mycobacteroides abscessus]|uniref:hypothetical protein n=1 Tax=Mycobacteroides abscessus TaxID=36809 RepID=UPI001053B7A2|nr:hypothetical protein [Mycobacteroides abscessus]